ncbi:glycosyltransferase family 39 protein [Lacisediminihabitans sp. FW035]
MSAVTREATVSRLGARTPRRARAPLTVGFFAFLVSFAFSWLPSVWFDEAATVSATGRSWSELFRMLGNVDAVHGLYYVVTRLWFDLVGYSPVTLRLLSAVAVGVGAGLIVILVRLFASSRIAIISGIVFAILPRITWAGTEGRSYALTAALAVALTLVFLLAWRSTSSRLGVRAGWWAAYGLLAVISCTTFLYLVFLVAAHGVTAVWTLIAAGRPARRPLIGWAAAAAASALLVLPLASLVSGQSAQVDWIAPIDGSTFHAVFVTQWFLGSPVLAALGWTLIGIAIVGLWRSRPLPGAQPGVAAPSAASVLLPWLVVPTVGLLLASVTVSPLFSPRYLTFSAPAAAILIGLAISRLRRRRLVLASLALCAVLAAPQYLHQRTPEAKQNSSWSEVASFIASERSADATVTQAVIYGPVRQHRAATTRVIAYSYPAAFAGLVDVKLKTPAAETGELWETRYPLDGVTARLDGVNTVWLVTSDKQDWRPTVTRKLAELGYSLADEKGFTGVNVLRFER